MLKKFDYCPGPVSGIWTPEYHAWRNALVRCGHLHGQNVYVNRGIIVCDEWLPANGFEKFLAHIGTKPDPKFYLDRINNNKNYEPGNVRWISSQQSADNRSTTGLYTFEGKTQTIQQWADEYEITYGLLRGRLRRGLTIDQALTTPKTYQNRRIR